MKITRKKKKIGDGIIIKLEGWLCFFDAQITGPVAFYEVEDLPQSIVILTDGYAPFPDEKRARGIPVLWIIDNEEIEVPWGKIARIEVT